MKKIDLSIVPAESGGSYPSPFDAPCRAQSSQRLARFAGLTQFGLNVTVIATGAWSSQRHWHTGSDEFVYVLSGEVVLVTDGGEEILRAGDAAGFPANDPNGHCLQNRAEAGAEVLEIGTRVVGDTGYYNDVDMVAPADGKPAVYTHRDGAPYQDIERRGP
jgi:uncharacterized cupin superfamily protein